MYVFGHVLIYIMCKFHVSTTVSFALRERPVNILQQVTCHWRSGIRTYSNEMLKNETRNNSPEQLKKIDQQKGDFLCNVRTFANSPLVEKNEKYKTHCYIVMKKSRIIIIVAWKNGVWLLKTK